MKDKSIIGVRSISDRVFDQMARFEMRSQRGHAQLCPVRQACHACRPVATPGR